MSNFLSLKATLAGKILIPMLSIFLGMWTVGTVSVGYIETQNEADDLRIETQNAVFQISKEMGTAQELLTLKAKSITDVEAVIEAVATQDKQTLLQILLPLKSSLKLDLVKIIDKEGTVVADLRSSKVGSSQLQDSEVLHLAQRGLLVTNIVVSEDSAALLLVKTLSVTSKQDDVGSIMVGYALTPDVLDQMVGAGRQHVVIFQGSEVLIATLPIHTPVRWTEESSLNRPFQVDGLPYLHQSIKLPQVANDHFRAIVLTPLDAFNASQRQMWSLVGGFGLLGGLLVTAAGLLVTRLITRRVTKLTLATQKLADGDLTVRIPVDGNDEVATLAIGFNHMIEQLKYRDLKIKTQVEKLEWLVQELQQLPERVHTEKMAGLGQMVAGIAHEINNPVSFIYSNVSPAQEYANNLVSLIQLYQKHFPTPPNEIQQVEKCIDIEFVSQDFSKLLDSMESGAMRIQEIVLSLRNFSRKDEAVMKTVNIHDGLDSTLVILEHRLKAQSNRPAIKVIKDYGDLPVVLCFAGEINQVFMNLLSNAIDALEESAAQAIVENLQGATEGCLQIRLRTNVIDKDWVSISIADNGPGIPDDIRNKLFDPFFTTKAVGVGTGLGLSISYQIVVEKHSGKILCNSHPGQGTEFIIQIPITQPLIEYPSTIDLLSSPLVQAVMSQTTVGPIP